MAASLRTICVVFDYLIGCKNTPIPGFSNTGSRIGLLKIYDRLPFGCVTSKKQGHACAAEGAVKDCTEPARHVVGVLDSYLFIGAKFQPAVHGVSLHFLVNNTGTGCKCVVETLFASVALMEND